MSRIIAILPSLAGLIFITMFANTIISQDDRSFEGTYNTSQIAIIHTYDKNNELTYKPVDNESFSVTGGINLDSNKTSYLSENGIVTKQTYNRVICIFIQIVIPIMFALALITAISKVFLMDDHTSYRYETRRKKKIIVKHSNVNMDRVSE